MLLRDEKHPQIYSHSAHIRDAYPRQTTPFAQKTAKKETHDGKQFLSF